MMSACYCNFYYDVNSQGKRIVKVYESSSGVSTFTEHTTINSAVLELLSQLEPTDVYGITVKEGGGKAKKTTTVFFRKGNLVWLVDETIRTTK